MIRPFLMLAGFFGLTGVALGAFAAHGLKSRLAVDYLAVFQTGVHYQLIHALALFGIGNGITAVSLIPITVDVSSQQIFVIAPRNSLS